LRQIGTLPGTTDPRVFGDYLLSLGVSSRAVPSGDGWAIWIHDEDHVAKAREELAAYERNPDDPRYRAAAGAAEDARRRSERLERQYRKNVRDVAGSWGGINARRRPLTVALVAACVAVFIAEGLDPRWKFWIIDHFRFFSLKTLARGGDMTHGLDDIHRGEIWRLITPAFLHGSVVHLVFNMWLTVVTGTLIETRRGTRTLLALVLLSAVASNVGQYIYVLNFDDQLTPWVGFSGVGYALFGYLWMKGQNEPEQGMMLTPSSIRLMLFWLLLGFAGFMNMANGAHAVGLIVGVLFGLARF